MVDEVQEWAWLLKTNRGDFFITVCGKWKQEEAASMVWSVFERIRLNFKTEVSITGMIPRKRSSGPEDRDCTIFQGEESTDPDNYYFFAGRKLWEVCGLAAGYDAEKILTKKSKGGQLI